MSTRSRCCPAATCARPSFSCYVYVDDAESLHHSWSDAVVADPRTGSRLMRPWDTDYGMVEFAVVDRSGNLLRFGSPRLDR